MSKIDPGYLLTDEQMRGFIVNGYVRVQTHLPDAVHEAIFNRSEGLFSGTSDPRKDFARNPQNNIVPMIPELRQVLEAPELVGALTSILGPDYLLHPHRHCHPNYPAGGDGDGTDNGGGTDAGPRLTMIPHKDGHANGAKPRHRVPRWAIIFYYPQDCPQEQGPTAVIPRSQYHHVLTHDQALQFPTKDSTIPLPETAAGGSLLLPESYVYRKLLPLSCPLGTVSIMHFDVGHSVLANLMERMRYGHKFVFMRTRNPSAPSWNLAAGGWQTPALPDDAPDNEIVWTSIWNWLRGSSDRFERGAGGDSGSVAEHLAALQSGTDLERAGAAGALGFAAARDGAVAAAVAAPLCAALRDAFEPVRLNALYALGAAGAAAIPHLLPLLQEGAEYFDHNQVLNINHVADALAAIGAPAVAPLVAALADPQEHVRASVAYGLGEMGAAAAGAVQALTRVVRDDSAAVRFHAISALGMIAKPAAPIIDALIPVLDSEGGDELFDVGISRSQLRNVAVQALIRVDARTPEAAAALARAVTDQEPYVAAFAGEQLRRIGTAEALGHLADALSWARWFSTRVVTEADRKKFFEKMSKMHQRQRAAAPATAV